MNTLSVYIITLFCLTSVVMVSGHLQLPLVGFGTAGLQSKTYEAVLAALHLGVRMIDSAQAQEWYNEVGVGSAVAEFEDLSILTAPVVIVTKIHPRSYGSIDSMDEKLAQSKANFYREGLDVVLLHAPWCWAGHCTPQEEAAGWETGWRNLVTLREKHAIQAIGVSNFPYDLLRKLVVDMGQTVDVVQNWMDPFHQDAEVREFCRQHDIQYMAYSSFGTQWNRNPNPVLTSAALQTIADAHAVSVPQVVMKWLSAQQVVAIPRTSQVAHMEDNFAELIHTHRTRSAPHNTRQECIVDTDVGVGTCGEGASSWALSAEELSQIAALDGSLGTPWD